MMYEIGTIHPTNTAGDIIIEGNISPTKRQIRFLNSGATRTINTTAIQKKQIRDYTLPTLYGKGIIGIGKYVTRINGKHTPEYNVWRGMLQRCYDTDYLTKYPTYEGTTVCK